MQLIIMKIIATDVAPVGPGLHFIMQS